jgi:hypothetical protein
MNPERKKTEFIADHCNKELGCLYTVSEQKRILILYWVWGQDRVQGPVMYRVHIGSRSMITQLSFLLIGLQSLVSLLE